MLKAKHYEMKKEEFNYLMGKTRQEIKKELGDGFNYFKSERWTYELGRTWIGKKIILSITFKDERASDFTFYKTFGRA